ncbi:MAG: helicase-related protein [Acidimicrobiales bacterium]|jgi:ATP-dependent helicase YprA (DUF1998 family)
MTKAALVETGHRTITFCRSRKGVELVAADITRRLPPRLDGRVLAYRAGYLADERRMIEDKLTAGELSGIVATSALELVVDVGALDACVLNGFPGTIASMWQQAGRAGRRSEPSVTVLVAGQGQLDRYLMQHPDEVFSRPPEPSVVNTANPFILDPHLACAAYELPLSYDDLRWWSQEEMDDGVRNLVREDALRLQRRWRNGRATSFPSRSARFAWSTLLVSTSKPTAERMWRAPARSATSKSSRPSPRAKATNASVSKSTTSEDEARTLVGTEMLATASWQVPARPRLRPCGPGTRRLLRQTTG